VAGDPRITDLVACTRDLVQRGVSTEEIVSQLRRDGFSLVESIAGLIRAGGMTSAEAREAVVDSPTWADVRESVESHRWIEPPNPPANDSIERLRAACEADPRIAEAWFIGRRMTRGDGSIREHDGLAVVLCEPFPDRVPPTEAEIELMEKLTSAAPEVDVGGWLFTSHAVSSEVSELGILIYQSPVPAT
jgi:hypothetical protein